ncbi:hypothetical protein E3E11_03350 [Oecophyllibacter saccharovorans]|uniref:hypothetical protein n=1 Tax=Oecophyllibacter saccharovorans TaxID=2558360 RepID=UPI001143D721|nr:hypothetical protein [Oecophyllibacter saccharovorans]QDH15063.1 hypothetical protein E3E11_03350 [Oecophyllibacter saccharovorans]
MPLPPFHFPPLRFPLLQVQLRRLLAPAFVPPVLLGVALCVAGLQMGNAAPSAPLLPATPPAVTRATAPPLPEDAPAGAKIAAQRQALSGAAKGQAGQGREDWQIFVPPDVRLAAQAEAARRSAVGTMPDQLGPAPHTSGGQGQGREPGNQAGLADMPEVAMEPYLTIPDFNITLQDRQAGHWGRAVQQAIAVAKAHGGGTVRLLAHAYPIEGQDLFIPSGVTLEGASPGATVLAEEENPGTDQPPTGQARQHRRHRSRRHLLAAPARSTEGGGLPSSLILEPGHTVRLASATTLRHLAVLSAGWVRTPGTPPAPYLPSAPGPAALTIDGATTFRLSPALLPTSQELPNQAGSARPPAGHKTAKTPRWATLNPASSSSGPATDVTIEDVVLLGFGQGIEAHDVARLHVTGVTGRVLNGVQLDGCRQACRFYDVSWDRLPAPGRQSPLNALPSAGASSGPEPGQGLPVTLQAPDPFPAHWPAAVGWPVRLWSGEAAGSAVLYRLPGGRFTLRDLQLSEKRADVQTGPLQTSPTRTALRLELSKTFSPGIGFDLRNGTGVALYETTARHFPIAYRLGEGLHGARLVDAVAQGQPARSALAPETSPTRAPLTGIGLLTDGDAQGVQWVGGQFTDLQRPLVLTSQATGAGERSGTDSNLPETSLIGAVIEAPRALAQSCMEILGGTAQVSGIGCAGGAPVLIGSSTRGRVSLLGVRLGNSVLDNQSRFQPVLLDSGSGLLSGLRPARIESLAALPSCNEAQLGSEVYLTRLRKPGEPAGAGSGGQVICTGLPDSSRSGNVSGTATGPADTFGWVSQFSGLPVTQ